VNVPEPRTQPTEINLSRAKQLEVHWADGHRSLIPLDQLRRACPCAACRASRDEHARSPLAVNRPVGKPGETVVVDQAELVGDCGLRIRWQDGHEAGICDFALIRLLG
jgi:DUF971 family protein